MNEWINKLINKSIYYIVVKSKVKVKYSFIIQRQTHKIYKKDISKNIK